MPDTFIDITPEYGRIGHVWWMNSNLCNGVVETSPGVLERWDQWGGWGFAFDWFRQIEFTRSPL
jgi:hypothetical protein